MDETTHPRGNDGNRIIHGAHRVAKRCQRGIARSWMDVLWIAVAASVLPAAWSLDGRPLILDRIFSFYGPFHRPVGYLMPRGFYISVQVQMSPNSWCMWARMRRIQTYSSSFLRYRELLRVSLRWGGRCDARTRFGAPATLRDLAHDSIARDVYMEWNGLENRMEWHKEFDNSVLLSL
ncbi:hypothetical protein EDB87DRAFT_1583994 [Lactarius vividus]|nr:hypothetical protein EDB87DRAFT_1583994 [Lactarius vividus]